MLALAGCGLSERPYLQKRVWPLMVQRPDVRAPNPRGRTLLIRTVQAGPGLEARGLQSLQEDGSVRLDFYEEWAVPPAQGAETSLRQWLTGSGLFAAILAPGSRMEAEWVLEATLTEFIAEPTKNRARAAMTVVVLDQRNSGTRVLAQRRLTAEAPLANAEAPAVVAALRQALEPVLAQAEQALAGLS
jgi:ABC-type uncharacterized transport system auxiliary subunit